MVKSRQSILIQRINATNGTKKKYQSFCNVFKRFALATKLVAQAPAISISLEYENVYTIFSSNTIYGLRTIVGQNTECFHRIDNL